ncbi:MAG: maleylacetoacetate isomerase [Rhodothalassiaceae bacterium]
MRLYTYFRSSASFRVRIALNLKGIAYEPAFVHLPKGEQRGNAYRGKNPQGLVPALEDGDAVLTQSLAIIEYLDETHPEPPFLPADPVGRARVRAMAMVVACDIHPLNNLQVLKYLKDPLGHDQEAIDRWYRHWVSRGFGGLEELVRRHGSEKYCFGDRLSLADICLVPQMWNARRFKTDLTPFPNLVRIDTHLSALPAFAEAAPPAQPDAF